MKPLEVIGYVAAPRFEPVARVLGEGASVTVGERERRADLGGGGGAFCAYVDGECVVDLWAGAAAPGRAWERDTRAVVMSSTKGLTALCAHLLEDRGELDLDAPVTRYWPEFGCLGKEPTTVRQLLSHQSGAIGLPGSDDLLSWDGRGWSDTVAIAAGVARGAPAWEPGTRHGYHGVTFGWLVGELVRRISGTSLGTFFEAEVARPLGVAGSVSIGTPRAELGSVATVMEFAVKPGKQSALRTIDPESKSGRSVLAGSARQPLRRRGGPAPLRRLHEHPGRAGGRDRRTGRHRDRTGAGPGVRGSRRRRGAGVARLGGPLRRPSRCVAADAVMTVPTRWAVGYSLEPPASVPGVPPMHGPNDGAFGHMGAGGQIGFADPVARVGCGFVRNHLENQALPLMGACLVDVLYSCLHGYGDKRGGGVRS